MIADVFGVPVEVPAQAEGAAFGAALQALWACHTAGGAADLATIARDHVQLVAEQAARPDKSAAPAYDAAYQRFQRQLEAATSIYR